MPNCYKCRNCKFFSASKTKDSHKYGWCYDWVNKMRAEGPACTRYRPDPAKRDDVGIR